MRALRSLRNYLALTVVLVGIGLLQTASVVAADRDFFVSSSGNHAIKRYDGVTGAYLGNFVAPGAGGLNDPQEVLFLQDGSMIVTGFGNSSILHFDGDTGDYLGPFTSGYSLVQPTKTTFGPDGLLYVSQWGGEEKVVRFDAVTGSFVDVFTSLVVPKGMGHTWDHEGNLYVAAYRHGNDGNIHKYAPDGTRISIFVPATLGILQGPVNVWVDGPDLVVLDWGLGSAERFRLSDGAHRGRIFGGMQRAEGFLFHPDGMLYVCEWGADRVRQFTSIGSFVGVFLAGGGLSVPNSIALGPVSPVVRTTNMSFGQVKSGFGPD